MAGPADPFNKGRLVLVFVGLAIVIVGAWLVLRARPEPESPMVGTEPQPAAEQPVAYYLARGDAARGEAYWARCAACHTIDRGGRHGVGPNLWGVAGAPIAAREGYSSSSALGARGGSWDWEAMNGFLRSPRTFQPGNRMAFAGVSNPQDRADVMLYMNRQGGTLTPPAGPR